MKSVKQEDYFGCAIACVAFVTYKKYKKIRLLFLNGNANAKDRGFYCKEIVEVLLKCGLSYQYKYIKPWIRNKIYSNFSIVYIKRSKKYAFGHYLIRYKNLWMDPWINYPNPIIKGGFRKKLPGHASYVIFQ